MQNIFDEVASLDKRCYHEFYLSEDILMEHAANGIAEFIRQNFSINSTIFISCGGSNNGADGMAVARLLHKDFKVMVYLCKKPRSNMAKLQFKRIESLGVDIVQEIYEADIIIDAIVGTGLSKELSSEIALHVRLLNKKNAIKIACDIPTGLSHTCDKNSFVANYTLTMGALKESMFSDDAKDVVGEIKVIDLGISRKIYEISSKTKLLDESDLKLPIRKIQNSHKGTFGHLAVISGDKKGASMFSALAAFRFGAALVSLITDENLQAPLELMLSRNIPKNATAITLGMGLDIKFNAKTLKLFLNNTLPLLLDADIFYHSLMKSLLLRKNIVLTPHPKEFTQLLRVSDIADITVNKLQNNRFFYARIFAKKYNNTVLVLKGANIIIAQNENIYVNPHGTNVLAKGGSGDVLSGLIASLLAQDYTPLDAAINGSLAHTKLAKNYNGSNFSLSPNDLIDGIKNL